MGQFSSYFLYQKFETRGSQEAIPVYPNVYSIDADGTRERVVKIQDDPQCGYDPPIKPIYKWVNIPITQDYICDDCPTYQTRWVRTDETICSGTPVSKKLVATYTGTGGITNEVDCNDSTTLTTSETKPSGYEYTAMTNAVIGDCVNSIGWDTFKNCTSLASITIPNSVTNIGEESFFNCSALTSVSIPSGVTIIGNDAFYYCSSLQSITCLATTPPTLRDAVFAYTNNCPIYVPCESVSTYKSTSGWSSYTDRIFGIPPCEPSPYDEYFSIKNERLSEPQTLTLRLSGAPRNYYYSSDGEVWEYLYSGSGNVVIPSGAKYYFKGEGATLIGADNIGTFVMSSTNPNDTSVTIQGNIMSLLYKDNFKGQLSLEGKDHIFESLFNGCTYITSAENLVLPATTLSDRCYQNMFNGCTNLRTAPELHATKIGYGSYSSMFRGCASLTKAPSILPAIPKNGGYAGMFYGCASLTTAPELPSVIVGESSYAQMFWGCKSLSYIKCLATSLNSGSTSFWTRGVSPTGTFVKAASMSNWTTGESGIPSGWTVQDA